MFDNPVIVRGGGDLGTGVAARLRRCGFAVVVLETAAPMAVRRTVSFSEAVYESVTQVEELTAVRVPLGDLADWEFRDRRIPVVIDPDLQSLGVLRASAVVDCVMAKRNLGTRIDMAPRVVALGPGFQAGKDVTAVVETNRGPDLGRVLWTGKAAPNTGQPGEVSGRGAERVLRAPVSGTISVIHGIGAIVEQNAVIALVGDHPITASFQSVVRGILRPGLDVPAGAKIGDIDPRLDPTLCYRISDKALAVAGGVLEAVLTRRNGIAYE